MNDARRKRIQNVRNKLEELKNEVEDIAAEEREYYDNMPPGFQQGERADEVATNLEGLDSDFDSIIDALDEAGN